MIGMEWDGLTDRDRYGDWYLKERDRFPDLARDADWDAMSGELGKNPGWVNLPGPGTAAGGFHYRLHEDIAHVHGSSRMDGDNGDFYQVTPDGWTKLAYSPRPPSPWSFPY
ncbi:hypothetical protein ABT373_05175 [Streptomyces sp. NPDC000070]|uniref:hypothetical protein n=1 Tax=Streptomyces sp. NPDC000070 TaxID=3154240 RepID=UPI00332509D2